MKRNIAVKVTAFMLCVITLIITVISVFGVAVLISGEFYLKPLDEIRREALWSTMYRYAESAAQIYHYNSAGDAREYFENRNYYYVIYDVSGKTVASNYEGQNTAFSESFSIRFDEWIYIPEQEEDTANVPETDFESEIFAETVPTGEIVTANPIYPLDTALKAPIDTGYVSEREYYEHQYYVEHEYNVIGYLPTEYKTTDAVSFVDSLVKMLYSSGKYMPAVSVVSFILFIICLIFLFCCAGWKKGEEKPRTCYFDRIPFDIFTAAYVFIFALALIFLLDFYFEDFEVVIAAFVSIIIGAILVVSYLYSVAARAKTGELFRNTVIWWGIKHILKAFRWICRAVSKVLSNLPLFGKTVFLLVILALWSFLIIVLLWNNAAFSIFLWIVGGTILSLLALYITYGVDKLKNGAKRIADGDFGHRIDTKYMLPSLRHHADSLNNISGGMALALEERLKSERFKTELITNVSHDLKTPLTSIVNYVDLLKTERMQAEVDNTKVDEYIAVLDRQSSRLRKLTEDLVEASKASTGNLEVNPSPIELGEMISQTEGEYAEKLAAKGLALIVRRPEDDLTVMADGKHLWRIFDNLMNNICKYALTGTRVYIDILEKEGRAQAIFRNISGYELNVSAKELTERFVRGDSSRHTEGSGLGLSIARSLAELNGGKLDIYIDGDLFKVVLDFNTIK